MQLLSVLSYHDDSCDYFGCLLFLIDLELVWYAANRVLGVAMIGSSGAVGDLHMTVTLSDS